MRVERIKIVWPLVLLVTRPSERKLERRCDNSRSDQRRRQTILRHSPCLRIVKESASEIKSSQNTRGIFSAKRINVAGYRIGHVVMIALHDF